MSDSPDFCRLADCFTKEEIGIRNHVREWVSARFRPIVAQHYRDGTFPFELVGELGELGVFGPGIKGYGCRGLGAVANGLMMQELERGDSGLRTFASVQGSLAMMAIYLFGSDEQKTRWLPAMAKGAKLGCFALTEPDFGSNPAGLQCRARKVTDGYRLSGRKKWIGNGSVADVAIVWARLENDSGVSDEGANAIRGFLVEKGTPGFVARVIEGKLSLRAALTAELEFNDCELPNVALLPETTGLRSALECLNHARYGIAWGAIGAAEACYEEAREYSLRREQFSRPLASFQLIQAKLARMLTEITKAQLLVFRLAQLKDAGELKHYHISMAKMNNVEMALDVARATRDILGGNGILDSHECFRHMCNLESVKTYEGTQDVHLLILGQQITGIPAFC
ncbi:MAG TPA: acyl-CoA dehydrogenase family protein [Chthoniobacterales bacterium]|jgi:glutaryl-CoA dehydrogenase